MNELITKGNPIPDTRCWSGVLEGLRKTFQGWVRDAVEDVISEKMSNAMIEDRLLTVEELCERWNISKSTLYSWETKGIIKPLPMGGRKKEYSMKEVHEVEISGRVKRGIEYES